MRQILVEISELCSSDHWACADCHSFCSFQPLCVPPPLMLLKYHKKGNPIVHMIVIKLLFLLCLDNAQERMRRSMLSHIKHHKVTNRILSRLLLKVFSSIMWFDAGGVLKTCMFSNARIKFYKLFNWSQNKEEIRTQSQMQETVFHQTRPYIPS